MSAGPRKPPLARDAALLVLKERYEQARQHENQRPLMTAALLTIAGWFASEIVKGGFSLNTLPMSLMLIFLGFFGTIFSYKHYERNKRPVDRCPHPTLARTACAWPAFVM